jgi:hypothetical protein
MAHQHSNAGSDMGAAFTGLILGSAFIGAILYGIVVLTNKHFENEKAEHKAGAVVQSAAVPVVG